MKFPSVEDIPGIETSRMNINTIDPFLYSAVESVRFALKHRNNFKRKADYESELIGTLRIQLDLFAVTHKSIRILFRRAYREPDKRLLGDGASLVREQVEKIFIIALVLDNPPKWIRQYMRSALKTDLMEFLLERDEHSDKPRYKQQLKEDYPKYLKSGQRPVVPGQKPVTLVSYFAMRALKYDLEFPRGPEPHWFAKAIKKRKNGKKQKLKTYIRNYFDFPTPGRVIGIIKNQSMKPFLIRWHKEYAYICEYTHVAFGKMMLPSLAEYKDWKHADMVDKYGEKVAARVLFTSHTAAASACALITEALIRDYGAKTELRDYWQQLYSRSLPSKAFWKLYIEKSLT